MTNLVLLFCVAALFSGATSDILPRASCSESKTVSAAYTPAEVDKIIVSNPFGGIKVSYGTDDAAGTKLDVTWRYDAFDETTMGIAAIARHSGTVLTVAIPEVVGKDPTKNTTTTPGDVSSASRGSIPYLLLLGLSFLCVFEARRRGIGPMALCCVLCLGLAVGVASACTYTAEVTVTVPPSACYRVDMGTDTHSRIINVVFDCDAEKLSVKGTGGNARCGADTKSAAALCGLTCETDAECSMNQTCFKELSVDPCGKIAGMAVLPAAEEPKRPEVAEAATGGPLRCGSSWGDANGRCGVSCPRRTNGECPAGQSCYADLSTGPCSNTPVVNPNPPTTTTTSGSGGPLRCGAGWAHASSICGVSCPAGTNAPCPAGQTCFNALPLTPCGSTTTTTTTPVTATIGDWHTCVQGDRCNAGFRCCLGVVEAQKNENKWTCRSSGCSDGTTTTTTTATGGNCVTLDQMTGINGLTSYWPNCSPTQQRKGSASGYIFGHYCSQEWVNELNVMLTRLGYCNDKEKIRKFLGQTAYETGWWSTLGQPLDSGSGVIHMIPANWDANARDMDAVFPGEGIYAAYQSWGDKQTFFRTPKYGWKSAAAWYKRTAGRAIAGCAKDLWDAPYDEQTRCILGRIVPRQDSYNMAARFITG